MGTWGPGPFDNDAASDLLDELQRSPSRFVDRALRGIVDTPAAGYIDVDDGGAGWAACELVAIAFGHGSSTEGLADTVLDIAAKLKPREEQRLLALDALARIADRPTSELAALRHEGSEGSRFDASLAELRARLVAASAGPRKLSKAKAGDVIAVPAAGADLFAVQVVGPGEVAVFEGTWPDGTAALAAVKSGPARRVPTSVNKLLRRGRMLGNVPVRKELKGRKLYASEAGAFEHYAVSTAAAGGLRIVSYDEARDLDLLRHHGEEALLAVALATQPIERVRSVDEREAELRARRAIPWAARREATTPGPFGDIAHLTGILTWVEDYGVENAVQRSHDEAVGVQGYGRPNEHSERGSYAFAGLVALWRGTWSKELWPADLTRRLPPPPDDALMVTALNAARTLADRVITRDAELRLIWDGAADQGAELRRWVASLQKALA